MLSPASFPTALGPRVLAESEDFIVVNKPAGWPAHPSKPGHRATLWHHLRHLLAYELVCGGQVSIINRLDRETSGVTLVAKTAASARALGMKMQRRELAKDYLAIVWGWPARDEWELDAPLIRLGSVADSLIYLKQAIHPAGASAQSHFRVLRRFCRPESGGKFALVLAQPLTGRTHQLRVHLAASGHAVVGDKLYGPSEECYLEFIQTGWTARLAETLLLPRQALHATSLSLEEEAAANDPGHGTRAPSTPRTVWQAPLPADLQDFLDGQPPR